MTDQKDPPWYDYLGAAERAEVRRLVAEVERLQGHMRALADTSVDRDTAGIFKGMWQGSERECEQLRAEIERLTEENSCLVSERIENEAEIERLTKIAQKACDETFEKQTEINQLRAALEPKPDLRALLPELAVIRQVMKEPKP